MEINRDYLCRRHCEIWSTISAALKKWKARDGKEMTCQS